MSDTLEQLKSRLAEYHGLESLASLLVWDQRTMMPPAGAHHRGDHLALLEGLAHDKLIDPDVGRLLDELSPLEDSLDPDSWDAATIRVARRDYEKAVQVPSELRGEMARAAAEAMPGWLEAKSTSNFDVFLPQLERNVELRRRYVECFDPQSEPYDVLLDDFEPEMKTGEVSRIFDEIKAFLVPLIAELREREVDDSFLVGDFPFAAGAGIDDVRITTHYYRDELKSLFSTMHEYGHGLYMHQLPREVAHLPVGAHASLGIHESQSRMWENLVGRSLPFWRFFYPRLQEIFPKPFAGIEVERFYAAVNKAQPSLIRIDADEVTYGMHVILRFELEQDIINGRVELSELPDRWAQKMHEYLGIEVPDHAHGVLQDMHWASGLIGYFSTYLLGTVMSVQLWEQTREALGGLDEQLERGEFAPLRGWLEEHVHSQGRKYPPQELIQRATGSTIDAKPYLAYLQRKFG